MLNILHLSKQWTAISSSKHLGVLPGRGPSEPSWPSGALGTGSPEPEETSPPGLGERAVPQGSLCVLPQAGVAERTCKDGLSTVTGMEPTGTHSHPAPASSHIVMDEGQEPAPDLCPGGGLYFRAPGPLGEGVKLAEPHSSSSWAIKKPLSGALWMF